MSVRHKTALAFTVAMAAPMVLVAVVARTPSAFLDSGAASLDTRIGNIAATVESKLDSRISSWANSNLRGLNTTKMGASLIIR